MCLDQTSRRYTRIERESIPSAFSVGLCLLPKHEGSGIEEVDVAHSSPSMSTGHQGSPCLEIISPCCALNPGGEWMDG